MFILSWDEMSPGSGSKARASKSWLILMRLRLRFIFKLDKKP